MTHRSVIHQSTISHPSDHPITSSPQDPGPMQWIEGKRLEMGMDTAVDHAKKQLRNLRGKNRKALKEEFQEWIDGDTDPEKQEWMNHHEWW